MTHLPRIAAVIGHADDFAMLEQCIVHHSRMGVGHFFVSADAAAVSGQHGLDQLATLDNVRVAYRREDDGGFEVFTAASARTAQWARPDWILIIDSDEFCMSAHGDLRLTAALKQGEIVSLRRFNVPLIRCSAGGVGNANPERLDEARFIVAPVRVDLDNELETMWPPWIMSAIAPRVMVRPGAIGAVPTGGHDVIPRAGVVARRFVADDAFALHLPFTTLERFTRKMKRVALAVDSLGHLFKPNEALHWRRWAAIEARGALDVEFEHQIFDKETADLLIRDGIMTTAGGYFASP